MLSALDQLNKQENYNKYKTAGEVVAKALDVVVNNIKHNTKVSDLCHIGDNIMNIELGKVYGKATLEYGKGISFPTSISVNNMVGYYSPIANNDIINKGDIVKVEMGCHVDGFPACVVYTVVVDNASGRRADVVRAVAEASREVYRIMKPDNTNLQVSDIMNKYADKYNCNLLTVSNIEKIAPGVISYQMSQNTLDGKNDETETDEDNIHTIILPKKDEDYEFGMSEAEFLENEVYAIDIAMSTGSGKISYGEHTPTLFKRNHNKRHGLKLKSSKNVLSKFINKHFPVHIKELTENENSSKVKVGLKECVKVGLIEPYEPYYEKRNEYVARIKFTVVVRKKPKLIIGRSMESQLQKLKKDNPLEKTL